MFQGPLNEREQELVLKGACLRLEPDRRGEHAPTTFTTTFAVLPNLKP